MCMSPIWHAAQVMKALVALCRSQTKRGRDSNPQEPKPLARESAETVMLAQGRGLRPATRVNIVSAGGW